MVPVVTAAQMRALDRIATEHIGLPSMALMEVAGRGVLDAVLAQLSDELDPGPVLIIAGIGNNGGDAVVVARHLAERNIPLTLVVLGSAEKFSGELEQQLDIVEALGVEPWILKGEAAPEILSELLEEADVVVDGLFGVGLNRRIKGWRARVIDLINDSEASVVSVDIPSGVCADTGRVLGVAVQADITVTFQCVKFGLVLPPGRSMTAEVQVADIGIPESRLPDIGVHARLLGTAAVQAAFLPREMDSHKGTYGHVLVVAGTPDCPGAALLAARAAQRSGSGAVTLASDVETVRRLAPVLGSLMGKSAGEDRLDAVTVQEAMVGCTATLVGPSLPADARTLEFLKAVLRNTRVPAVLDAGALSAMGTDHTWLKGRPGPTVLTPHPGEMATLLGTDAQAVQLDRVAAARQLAEASGAIVILKGASTVVSAPNGEVGICVSGNPGMAAAGAGDVLAGIAASLLGQGVEPYLAACAAAELHARAGDLAAETVSEAALLAEDVLAALGPAVQVAIGATEG